MECHAPLKILSILTGAMANLLHYPPSRIGTSQPRAHGPRLPPGAAYVLVAGPVVTCMGRGDLRPHD